MDYWTKGILTPTFVDKAVVKPDFLFRHVLFEEKVTQAELIRFSVYDNLAAEIVSQVVFEPRRSHGLTDWFKQSRVKESTLWNFGQDVDKFELSSGSNHAAFISKQTVKQQCKNERGWFAVVTYSDESEDLTCFWEKWWRRLDVNRGRRYQPPAFLYSNKPNARKFDDFKLSTKITLEVV